MLRTIRRFIRDERGIESVEWALILGIIVLAAVLAAATAKDSMVSIFSKMDSALAEAATDASSGTGTGG